MTSDHSSISFKIKNKTGLQVIKFKLWQTNLMVSDRSLQNLIKVSCWWANVFQISHFQSVLNRTEMVKSHFNTFTKDT